MMALRARALIFSNLAGNAAEELACRHVQSRAAQRTRLTVLGSTTKATRSRGTTWSLADSAVAAALESLGRPEGPRGCIADRAASSQRTELPPGLARNFIISAGRLIELETDMGIPSARRGNSGPPALRGKGGSEPSRGRAAAHLVARASGLFRRRDRARGRRQQGGAGYALRRRSVAPRRSNRWRPAAFASSASRSREAMSSWPTLLRSRSIRRCEKAARAGLEHARKAVPRTRFEKIDVNDWRCCCCCRSRVREKLERRASSSNRSCARIDSGSRAAAMTACSTSSW